MDLIVVTPVRLLGEGLAACLSQRAGVKVCANVFDLSHLQETLLTVTAEVVLIDVSLGVDLEGVRGIVSEYPDIVFVALGLEEQRQDVIRCGRAGIRGYVARSASLDDLCDALSNAVAGRLACSAEISCGLLRALFRQDSSGQESAVHAALTPREGEVLQLIGSGLSNKEIARELALGLSTVKHHVHNLLEKLQVSRRAQAMRLVRDQPWIAAAPHREPGGRALPPIDCEGDELGLPTRTSSRSSKVERASPRSGDAALRESNVAGSRR